MNYEYLSLRFTTHTFGNRNLSLWLFCSPTRPYKHDCLLRLNCGACRLLGNLVQADPGFGTSARLVGGLYQADPGFGAPARLVTWRSNRRWMVLRNMEHTARYQCTCTWSLEQVWLDAGWLWSVLSLGTVFCAAFYFAWKLFVYPNTRSFESAWGPKSY